MTTTNPITIVQITLRPLIEITDDTSVKVIVTYYVQKLLDKTDVKRTTHVFHSHNDSRILRLLLSDIFDKISEIAYSYDRPDTIVTIRVSPQKIHQLLREALKNVEG